MSRTKLHSLGVEWAHRHRLFRAVEPTTSGNVIHDRACAREWWNLTGKWPSWAAAKGYSA